MRIFNIAILIWLILTLILFCFFVFNYYNSMDIIKYRVDVYTAGDIIEFDLDEIKWAVDSYRGLMILSILYMSVSGVLLWFLYRYLKKMRQSIGDAFK